MTDQTCEFISIEGKRYPLLTEPFEPYVEGNPDILFFANNSACWRGYIGTWKIEDNQLFLIGLKGYSESNESITMKTLFPKKRKVFADWYTGELHISKGKAEGFLVLEVVKGVVKLD